MIQPKKYIKRKIKTKTGSFYERDVLTEEFKKWRTEEKKRLKRCKKYYEERKKGIKQYKDGWLRAEFYKNGQKHYYKDVMSYKRFIDMRFPTPPNI